MTDTETTREVTQNSFELVFSHVQRASDVVQEVRSISEQSENIRLISQAVSEMEPSQYVSYVSA